MRATVKDLADVVEDALDEAKVEDRLDWANVDGYELRFVNTDSGHRTIQKVEVSRDMKVIWLYEGEKP